MINSLGNIQKFIPNNIKAGSFQTIILKYTVGSFGIDEGGSLRICFKSASDIGKLQFKDATKDNYFSVLTPKGLKFENSIIAGIRPWRYVINIKILERSLYKSEIVTIILGDKNHGSNGWRMQTNSEKNYKILFQVDPLSTGKFINHNENVYWPIKSCLGVKWNLQIQSSIKYNITDKFSLQLICLDKWGNPSHFNLDKYEFNLIDIDNFTIKSIYPKSFKKRAKRIIFFFKIIDPGKYEIIIKEKKLGHAISNPFIVHNNLNYKYHHYWADLHGQTSETSGGSGSFYDYFDFAKKYAYLDVVSHQGNDFQLDDLSWNKLKFITKKYNKNHEFITLLGYEWSGTTELGGDHNIFFKKDNSPLFRSSNWLINQNNNNFKNISINNLYSKLLKHECIVIPHIGGRPANLKYSNSKLENLIEVHSHWGTFNWALERAILNGYKFGFVANSDDHMCRPGLSKPGLTNYGTIGGLTCILSKDKTRNSIWEALKNRRCYATTGQRSYCDMTLNNYDIGSDIPCNIKYNLNGIICATSPIRKIELYESVKVLNEFNFIPKHPKWVFIRFGGQRSEGRSRNVIWKGTIKFINNVVDEFKENGNYNLNYGIKKNSKNDFNFIFTTSGNFINVSFLLKEVKGSLVFNINDYKFKIDLKELINNNNLELHNEDGQLIEVYLNGYEKKYKNIKLNYVVDNLSENLLYLKIYQIDESIIWLSPWFVH